MSTTQASTATAASSVSASTSSPRRSADQPSVSSASAGRAGRSGRDPTRRGGHAALRAPSSRRDERDARERASARDDRRGVDAEPLLEQRAVDGAEVRRGAQVVAAVEQVQARGTRRSSRPGLAPITKPVPAAPWSVPEPFSCGAPPELAPDVHEHAVGEAARLEVALEGEQARRW